MLTCPCVSSELNTPAIHTVVVSDGLVGRRAGRRCGGCGRAAAGRAAPWPAARRARCSPAKNESSVAVLALGVAQRRRRRAPRSPTSARSRQRSSGARAEEGRRRRRRRARRGCASPAAPLRAAPSPGRRTRGRPPRSPPDDRPRASRRSRGRDARAGRESHGRVLDHRHRVLVLAAPAGKARSRKPDGRPSPARVARPWSWSASVAKLVAAPAASR